MGYPNVQKTQLIDGAAGSNTQTVNTDGQALVSTAHDAATPASGAIADASVKTTLVAAPGASLALGVTTLSLWQAGATQATVSIYDGDAVIARFPVTTEFGSGVDKDYTVPLLLTANTLLAVQTDAATALDWNVQTIEVAV